MVRQSHSGSNLTLKVGNGLGAENYGSRDHLDHVMYTKSYRSRA